MNNENQRYQELADFLKTRRAKVLPSQIGLPVGTRRRTPGLRREEVAQLTGIGLTWYTWLEQARPIHVSASVIENLSKALLLNNEERIHLYRLANQPLPADISEYHTTVSPTLQQVLDSLTFCPALVMDHQFNVIAWNNAACVVFKAFDQSNIRERNLLWAMFTDAKNKQLFVNWEQYAKGLLGRFRSACGQYIEDSWFSQFVDDLSQESPEFRQWWPLHDIHNESEFYKNLNHPIAGLLDFQINNFEVSGNTGLKMIVHVPLPESDTAAKMNALMAASH